MNTKLYDEHKNQSRQNSKVSVSLAEALPHPYALMFSLLTKISILTGPKIQWHV